MGQIGIGSEKKMARLVVLTYVVPNEGQTIICRSIGSEKVAERDTQSNHKTYFYLSGPLPAHQTTCIKKNVDSIVLKVP